MIQNADADTLRRLTDRFREKNPSGIIVLGTVKEDKPLIIAAVSKDLVEKNFHAGRIVKAAALIVGGGGGGRPDLAQAGGSDPSRLEEALAAVQKLVEEQTKEE